MPLRPKWVYVPLAISEYPCEVPNIEVLNLEKTKTFIFRLENKMGRKLFSQTFKGNITASNAQLRKFTFDNGTSHTVNFCLCKKKTFDKTLLTEKEFDLLPYFEAIAFVDDASGSYQRVTVDVRLDRGQYMVTVTIQIDYPAIVKYNFDVRPEKNFTHGNHPSLIHK